MNPHLEHIRPLTSLRFIAAMMIFLVHTSGRLDMPTFKDVFAFGHGVSFFYVLSGFILTCVYIGSAKSLRSGSFFRSRFARLYPLHIATFLAATFLVPNVQETLSQKYMEIPLQLTMTQSWLGTYKAAFGFNGPAWSISTEFGFYLIFPLFLKLYSAIYRIFLVSAIFTALVLIAAVYTDGMVSNWLWQALHVHPLGRLVEFIGGIVAARIFLTRNLSLSKFAFTMAEVMVVSMILLIGSLNKEIFYILGDLKNGPQLTAYLNRSGLFVLFAILIWVFAHAKGVISQILSHSILVLLGKISFAFYLIHQIVISFFEQNYELLLGYDPLVIFILLIFVSLGFSYAAHKLIEVPFQSLIRKPKSESFNSQLSAHEIAGPLIVAGSILTMAFLFSINSPGYKGPSKKTITQFKSDAIEANIKALNADITLTHYKFDREEKEICYEMLWAFGEMKIDTPVKRIINIPFQNRRKTISHVVILPTSAWAEPSAEKTYALDKFCFPTIGESSKKQRQLVRIIIRQETDDGYSPLVFEFESKSQKMLLLDYSNPGQIIWLNRARSL